LLKYHCEEIGNDDVDVAIDGLPNSSPENYHVVAHTSESDKEMEDDKEELQLETVLILHSTRAHLWCLTSSVTLYLLCA
jgi:hypothetical protein